MKSILSIILAVFSAISFSPTTSMAASPDYPYSSAGVSTYDSSYSSSSVASAATLPPMTLQMITSNAELVAYATEQVAWGYKGVSCNSLLRDGNTKDFISASGNVDQILKALNDETFSFRVFNLNDQPYEYAMLADSSGYPLFWGGFNSPGIRSVNGQFTFYNDDIELRLNDEIMIPVTNAVNARVQYTDSKGNQQQEYLNVNNGRIAFKSNMAGKYNDSNGAYRDGTLIVDRYYPNGGVAGSGINSGDMVSYAYSLTTGTQRQSWTVRGGSPTMLENYTSANDTGLPANASLEAKLFNVKLPEQQVNGQAVSSPHMTLTLTSERNVLVTVILDGDVARKDLVRCLYRDPTQTSTLTPTGYINVTSTVFNGKTQTIINANVRLKAGRHTIVFEIPEFESATPHQPYWYGYYGGDAG